ncbi:MAG: methyltransferase domain-containing protein [archaeon]|nr:methyltransferase domain-containing protein [archaeon]MCP8314718.1 methyltransferase domain-containing protein [archaeon]
MAEPSYDKALLKVFEDHAKEYDSWYFKHPAIYESEIRVLKGFDLKGLGLEIGIGTGVFASRIDVDLGIDPNLAMLRIAKERGVEAIRALGECLPFVNKIFDYVLMVCTLCFLDKPSSVIKESLRVLKNDGSLIVCIILKDSPWGRLYEEKKKAGYKFYSHAKFYTIHELKKLIAEQGSSIVEVKSTLSYSPSEEERAEEPVKGYKGSFVCLRVKRND